MAAAAVAAARVGSSGRVERAKEREREGAGCLLCFVFVLFFFYLFIFCFLLFLSFFTIFPIARLCFVTSWRSLALCESEKWLFIVKNEMWLVLTATLTVCVCVCV